MKNLILFSALLVSQIAFAGWQNINTSWMTARNIPADAKLSTITLDLPNVGTVEVKALVIKEQALGEDKPIFRAYLSTKDEVNEYFFIVAESSKDIEIKSLQGSKKSAPVIELDIVSDKKTLELNLMLSTTNRLDQPEKGKIFHGIVLFDQYGYKRP